MAPSSRPDGGGAAAAKDTSSTQARTPQAAQANTGPQSLVLSQDKAARRPRERRGNGWRRIVRPGPQPLPGAGHLVLEPVDLAASGEGRGGGAPGGPAGPPPLLPCPFVSRRFFAGYSIARAPQAAGRGRGEKGPRVGDASRLLGPRPPGDGVRCSGRPPKPGSGAPSRQGSGPRGDLERARPPAPLARLPVLSAATELVSSPARSHARPRPD